MKLRRLVAVPATAFLLGCYAYQPVTSDALAPGDPVRVRLTRDYAASLQEAIPGDAVQLDGRLLETAGDDLLIEVPSGNRQVGFHSQTLEQRLRLPWSSVVDIERKRLDRVRTGAIAAAAGALVGVVAWRVLRGDTGGSTEVLPGGPQELRVPLVTLPLW